MAENARLRKGLQGLTDILRRETRKSLSEGKKRASGILEDTIEVVLLQLQDRFTITETHIFYGDFVIKGRKRGGKKVPIDALEKFIKDKNFSVSASEIRGVAFAIQTNIFKFGIKKFDFIDITLKRVDQKIVKEVEDAAFENLDIAINQIFKETDRQFKATVS